MIKIVMSSIILERKWFIKTSEGNVIETSFRDEDLKIYPN